MQKKFTSLKKGRSEKWKKEKNKGKGRREMKERKEGRGR